MPTKNEFGQGRPIVFVEATVDPDAAVYIVASDLEHFLEFVLEKQILCPTLGDFSKSYWPFDEERVLAKDPNIVKFENVALPWDA